jgi:hypothetical protein
MARTQSTMSGRRRRKESENQRAIVSSMMASMPSASTVAARLASAAAPASLTPLLVPQRTRERTDAGDWMRSICATMPPIDRPTTWAGRASRAASVAWTRSAMPSIERGTWPIALLP